jgi:hypothetical protein
VELANSTGDTIAQVADQAHHGVQRACDSDAWSSGSLPTPVHPLDIHQYNELTGYGPLAMAGDDGG